MGSANEPVEIYGAPGSPYTRKMLAILRFRRIPYVLGWDGHMVAGTQTHPAPKVSIIPIMYFATDSDVKEVAVDSTPIIRRLEKDYDTRSVIPTDPALAFMNFLIEDFGDEWVTKFMFHYRWAYDEDAKHAAPCSPSGTTRRSMPKRRKPMPHTLPNARSGGSAWLVQTKPQAPD